uniref:Adenomatous polyposis coli n=1 Tax=Hofstenia miamia TaxID=442651 RepID=A0A068CND0_HOFMI|nr:adenomatous polyposis coli [Hofstenia miamia]
MHPGSAFTGAQSQVENMRRLHRKEIGSRNSIDDNFKSSQYSGVIPPELETKSELSSSMLSDSHSLPFRSRTSQPDIRSLSNSDSNSHHSSSPQIEPRRPHRNHGLSSTPPSSFGSEFAGGSLPPKLPPRVPLSTSEKNISTPRRPTKPAPSSLSRSNGNISGLEEENVDSHRKIGGVDSAFQAVIPEKNRTYGLSTEAENSLLLAQFHNLNLNNNPIEIPKITPKTATVGTQTAGDPPPVVDVSSPDKIRLTNELINEAKMPNMLYHDNWAESVRSATKYQADLNSMMSFKTTGSLSSNKPSCLHLPSSNQGFSGQTKVDVVYSLLAMLGTHDKNEIAVKFFNLSSNPKTCASMRDSGCIAILLQLIHGHLEKQGSVIFNLDTSPAVRVRASVALCNVISSQTDSSSSRTENKILNLLSHIRGYCEAIRVQQTQQIPEVNYDPVTVMNALMRASFHEQHRQAICLLGGLQAVSELLVLDQELYLLQPNSKSCTLRRYCAMTLTNLTFGDGTNKSLICSWPSVLETLVAQLSLPTAPELKQVTASVLRNLSWRADQASKEALRRANAVTLLMKAALTAPEPTLRAMLSALWNLSAHSSANKADICAVEGALPLLVDCLDQRNRSLPIVENGGGILRNVSSHLATRPQFRRMLRQGGCLDTLVSHLKSPSLTVVSNACGTLWNLSAKDAHDQQLLIQLGAVPLLRNLVQSKHKTIAIGSQAALRNLQLARPMSPEPPPSSEEPSPNVDDSPNVPPFKINPHFVLGPSGLATSDSPSSQMAWLQTNLPRVDATSSRRYTRQHATCSEQVERPVDFSLQFKEQQSPEDEDVGTDDQPTDFSLRYKEQDEPATAWPIARQVRFSSIAVEDGSTREDDINQYYVEGTPLTFSRNSSLSSLASHDAQAEEEDADENADEEEDKKSIGTSETPQVQDTPLMFSRHSSLSSLSDFEATSIHSNCTSEQPSRGFSGVISPSDLPDSPSQTRPLSPKLHINKSSDLHSTNSSNIYNPHKELSNFDPNSYLPATDEPRAFADEGTPLEFSCTSSLSALSFEDNPKIKKDADMVSVRRNRNHSNLVFGKLPPKKNTVIGDVPQMFCTEGTPYQFSAATSLSDLSIPDHKNNLNDNVDDNHSETSSVGDDPAAASMLMDAIQSAMPEKSSKIGQSRLKPRIPVPISKTKATAPTQHNICNDSVRVYQVEGTPLNFSTATSLSDLSIDDKPQVQIPVATVTGLKMPTVASRRLSSKSQTYSGCDSPHVYCVEGTPAVFSRNDSLSSLECDEEIDEKSKVNGEAEEKLKSERRKSVGEVSTTSSQGLDVEDQELLNECINSAMPTCNSMKSSKNKGRASGIPSVKSVKVKPKSNDAFANVPKIKRGNGMNIEGATAVVAPYRYIPPSKPSSLQSSNLEKTKKVRTKNAPASVSPAGQFNNVN